MEWNFTNRSTTFYLNESWYDYIFLIELFSFVKYFDSIHNVTIPDPKDLPRSAGLITFQSSEFLDSLDNDTDEGTSLFFWIVSNLLQKGREGNSRGLP